MAGLKQSGWDGVFIAPTGYGADLLGSEPAVAAGQGVIFSNAFTPVENDTPATQQLSEALQAAGNEVLVAGGLDAYFGGVSAVERRPDGTLAAAGDPRRGGHGIVVG